MSLADRLHRLRRRAQCLCRSRRTGVVFVAAAFVLSRAIYIGCLGVRFHAKTLDTYLQFIDPLLLRTDLLRSLFYLRDQPPAMNLLVGIVLKALPDCFALAFHAGFLAMGLAGAVAAFLLARRLGCGGWLAAIVATLLFVDPGTVFHEHQLFYTHPVAVLLILGGLGLHRLLRSGRQRDAFFAFAALALVVLTRGTFHLVFYLGVLIGAVVVRPRWWRPMLVGALVPTLSVGGLYVKQWLLYRGLFIGGPYREFNLYIMRAKQVGDQLQPLLARGAITGACDELGPGTDFDGIVRREALAVPASGIPVRDTTRKSTRASNWHSDAATAVARLCVHDAHALEAAFPGAYQAAVEANVARYFRPIVTSPDPEQGDTRRFRGLIRWVRRTFMLRTHDGTSWTIVLGVVLAALAPVWFLGRWLRIVSRVGWRAARVPSTACVAAFAAATVLSAALVVILYSPGDHDRYRAEVVMLGYLVAAATLAALSRFARLAWRRRIGRVVAASGPPL